MCAVSVMYDWGQTVPMQTWTPPAFEQFKEILRRLEALDKKLAQPDCDDPAKAAWMHEVEKRLSVLESA